MTEIVFPRPRSYHAQPLPAADQQAAMIVIWQGNRHLPIEQRLALLKRYGLIDGTPPTPPRSANSNLTDDELIGHALMNGGGNAIREG
jgi:hypothetical protein